MAKKPEMEFSKRTYIKIARDLCYPESVIEKLKAAKNDIECTRIMKTHRERSTTYGGHY